MSAHLIERNARHDVPGRRRASGSGLKRPHDDEDCWRELEKTKARLASTQERLAQRELELAERDHRIANSLQLVVTLINLQERRLQDGQAKDALAATQARIAAIAGVHRRLAHGQVDGEHNLKALLDELAAEFQSAWGLRCEVETDSLEVAPNVAANIALVISELAINAGKHAYGGDGGVLGIRCERPAEGDLMIDVADAGRGLPDDFDLHGGGLGMTIANAIMVKLGGEIRAENGTGGGAHFVLRVPIGARPRA